MNLRLKVIGVLEPKGTSPASSTATTSSSSRSRPPRSASSGATASGDHDLGADRRATTRCSRTRPSPRRRHRLDAATERLHRLHPAGPARDRRPHRRRLHHPAWAHRRSEPVGRRDRDHEHHAGERHGADPGDRAAQGARRPAAGHPGAVPGGGGGPHVDRRALGILIALAVRLADRAVQPGPGDRHAGCRGGRGADQRGGRPALRALPGTAGGAPAAHRGAARGVGRAWGDLRRAGRPGPGRTRRVRRFRRADSPGCRSVPDPVAVRPGHGAELGWRIDHEPVGAVPPLGGDRRGSRGGVRGRRHRVHDGGPDRVCQLRRAAGLAAPRHRLPAVPRARRAPVRAGPAANLVGMRAGDTIARDSSRGGGSSNGGPPRSGASIPGPQTRASSMTASEPPRPTASAFSLRELEDRPRDLFELYLVCDRDAPWDEPIGYGFDDWRRHTFDRPMVDHDGASSPWPGTARSRWPGSSPTGRAVGPGTTSPAPTRTSAIAVSPAS